MILGWGFVVWAFISGSILFGVFAVGVGYILRKDYDARSQGLALIIMGIASGLFGSVVGNLTVWYMSNYN
jgi:hypothetical protein